MSDAGWVESSTACTIENYCRGRISSGPGAGSLLENEKCDRS